MNHCIFRPVADSDIDAAILVLRSSITISCVADHQNDEATLERWLRNKTSEHFRIWLSAQDNFMIVALIQGTICGVDAVRQSGSLDLCYVDPSWQGHGVGQAILSSLESKAKEWGVRELRLVSTRTARAFYERHGYEFIPEESGPGFGVLLDYRYRKKL
jgi:GNAT superfamily N-acetyltransferase